MNVQACFACIALSTILAHGGVPARRTMGVDNQGAAEAPAPDKISVIRPLTWK
jgi:hypothetical protein